MWQAGLALSGGASRVAARGPNHDTTPAALAAGAGCLAGKGAAKRHGPDRVRQAPRAEGGSLSSGRHRALGSSCELSKVAVHTGDPGFFFYIFMNRWGRNNFVPRPPYWHGRIEIRQREMELEPGATGYVSYHHCLSARAPHVTYSFSAGGPLRSSIGAQR